MNDFKLVIVTYTVTTIVLFSGIIYLNTELQYERERIAGIAVELNFQKGRESFLIKNLDYARMFDFAVFCKKNAKDLADVKQCRIFKNEQ